MGGANTVANRRTRSRHKLRARLGCSVCWPVFPSNIMCGSALPHLFYKMGCVSKQQATDLWFIRFLYKLGVLGWGLFLCASFLHGAIRFNLFVGMMSGVALMFF